MKGKKKICLACPRMTPNKDSICDYCKKMVSSTHRSPNEEITTEWLTSRGFKKNDENEYYNGGLIISYSRRGVRQGWWFFMNFEYFEIDYKHEVRDLYKAIRRKELI